MIKRRKFLKTSVAIPAATLITNSLIVQEEEIPTNDGLVVSTWLNEKANEAAWAKILNNKSALDAVEVGAMVPESDPSDSSVGYGGLPDRSGKVTLDACIMDAQGNAGSVSYLKGFKHPISVARKVMETTPHVMLVGKGAEKFALRNGFKKENLLTKEAKRELKNWKKEKRYSPEINAELHDTIGILAIDKKGDISGACTTSGLAFKMEGRVGDSPIIGAGLFVDNEVGGAVATGLGEAVLKSLGTFLVVELMRNGYSPTEACKEAVMRIIKKQKDYVDFQVGFLALNTKGEVGAYSIQPEFMYAVRNSEKAFTYNSDSYIRK
ncbi:MAG: N(4)-(beta-N-acetylglucosaminyl)-L-asparaginase [Bacteroidota bacterium]